jgi:hypothetical protein
VLQGHIARFNRAEIKELRAELQSTLHKDVWGRHKPKGKTARPVYRY